MERFEVIVTLLIGLATTSPDADGCRFDGRVFAGENCQAVAAPLAPTDAVLDTTHGAPELALHIPLPGLLPAADRPRITGVTSGVSD